MSKRDEDYDDDRYEDDDDYQDDDDDYDDEEADDNEDEEDDSSKRPSSTPFGSRPSSGSSGGQAARSSGPENRFGGPSRLPGGPQARPGQGGVPQGGSSSGSGGLPRPGGGAPQGGSPFSRPGGGTPQGGSSGGTGPLQPRPGGSQQGGSGGGTGPLQPRPGGGAPQGGSGGGSPFSRPGGGAPQGGSGGGLPGRTGGPTTPQQPGRSPSPFSPGGRDAEDRPRQGDTGPLGGQRKPDDRREDDKKPTGPLGGGRAPFGGSKPADEGKKDDKPGGGGFGSKLPFGGGSKPGESGSRPGEQKKDDKPGGGGFGSKLPFGGGAKPAESGSRPGEQKKDDKPGGGGFGSKLPFGGGAKPAESGSRPGEQKKDDKPGGGGFGSKLPFGGGAKPGESGSRPGEQKKDDKPGGGGFGSKLPFGGGGAKPSTPAAPGSRPGGSAPAQSPFGASKQQPGAGGKPATPMGKASSASAAGATSAGGGIGDRVKGIFGGGKTSSGRDAGAAKAARPSKAPTIQKQGLSLDNKLDILGVSLVLGSLALLFSSASTTKGQLTEGVNNLLGQTLGWGAIAVPLLMMAIGVWLILRHFGDQAPVVHITRLIGIGMLYLGILVLLQYISSLNYTGDRAVKSLSDLNMQLYIDWHLYHTGGGWVGVQLYYLLVQNITEIGGFFVLLGWIIVSLMLALSLSASELAMFVISIGRSFQDSRRRRAQAASARRAEREAALAASAPLAPAAPLPAPMPAPQLPAARPQALPAPAASSASAPALPATSAVAAAPPERSIPIMMGGRNVASPERAESVELTPGGAPDKAADGGKSPAGGGSPGGFGSRLRGALPQPGAKPSSAPTAETSSALRPPGAPEEALIDKPLEKAAPGAAAEAQKSADGGRLGGFGSKLRGAAPTPGAKPAASPESKPADAKPASAPEDDEEADEKSDEESEKNGGRFGGFGSKLPFGGGAKPSTTAASAPAGLKPPGDGKPFSAKPAVGEPPVPPEATTPTASTEALRPAASGLSGAKPLAPRPSAFAPRGAAPNQATPNQAGTNPASKPPLDDKDPFDDEDDLDGDSGQENEQPVRLGDLMRPPSPPPSAGKPENGESAASTAPGADERRPVGKPVEGSKPPRPFESKPAAPFPGTKSEDKPKSEDPGWTKLPPAQPKGTGPLARPQAPFAARPAAGAPGRAIPKPLPDDEEDEDLEDDDEILDEGDAPEIEALDEPAAPVKSTPFGKTTPFGKPAPFGKPSPFGSKPAAPDKPAAEKAAGDDGDAESAAQKDSAAVKPSPFWSSSKPAAPPGRSQAAPVSREDEDNEDEDDVEEQKPAASLKAQATPAKASPPMAGSDKPAGGEKPAVPSSSPFAGVRSSPPPMPAPMRTAPPLATGSSSPPARVSAPPAASKPPPVSAPRPANTPPPVSTPPPSTAAPVMASKVEDAPEPLPTAAQQTLAPRKSRKDWRMPDFRTLLTAGSEQEIDHEVLLQRAKTIEETLDSFGAPGKVVEVRTGPVITQFGVEPEYLSMRGGKKTRVKVGAIAALDKDLQLALGAKSIRIEAPVPGKGYVGIEVPNQRPAVVRLRDVMESDEFQKLTSPLSIALGQGVDGTPVSADLDSMPHLLIAGTTGSGKSVCVNSIISSLLLRNKPDVLKFIMVDPKRVELTAYNGIPHLAAPVVVELERIVGVLKWVTREMDERYRRFSSAGARNIQDFNRHLPEGEPMMPYIVVIIDELADLMMLAPDETERVITRIAALARATGIHLVIATQRPSVDVVTGLIKANFPARIAFAVAGGVDSRVILDQPGAERLLGRGDMLYMSADSPAPQRLQGVYVEDTEINNITRYWRTQMEDVDLAASARPMLSSFALDDSISRESGGSAWSPPRGVGSQQGDSQRGGRAQQAFWDRTSPPAPASRPAGIGEDAPHDDDDGDDVDDAMYEEAVEMVRRLNKASVSLLQRRLRIGYTRAARLIDLMEERGVIGPPGDGSKPRDVLPGRD